VKICHNILNNHLQDHHKYKNVKKEEEAKGVYMVSPRPLKRWSNHNSFHLRPRKEKKKKKKKKIG
jgi:hypothetical protein